jgi:hypothetical protein
LLSCSVNLYLQILTSVLLLCPFNPKPSLLSTITTAAVESWGHFPRSKSRLVTLLSRLQPRGLAFISGDVHHGEMAHPLRALEQARLGLQTSPPPPPSNELVDSGEAKETEKAPGAVIDVDGDGDAETVTEAEAKLDADIETDSETDAHIQASEKDAKAGHSVPSAADWVEITSSGLTHTYLRRVSPHQLALSSHARRLPPPPPAEL